MNFLNIIKMLGQHAPTLIKVSATIKIVAESYKAIEAQINDIWKDYKDDGKLNGSYKKNQTI